MEVDDARLERGILRRFAAILRTAASGFPGTARR
jgi:hypothetical protein